MTSIRLFTGFQNFKRAFGEKKLRSIFTVIFLMVFGFNFFTQFFQVFLIRKFQYSATDIAYLFGYIGLWLVLAQGGINRPLSKKYSPAKLASWSALLCAVSFPILLLPVTSWWLYLIVPLIAVFNGVNTPNLTALVSLQAGPEDQGAILGIRQSVFSAAMAIPPIIAGFITTINVSLPIWAAALSTLLGWVLFRFSFLASEKKESLSPASLS